MDQVIEKRKEKPKRGRRRQIIAIGLVLLACSVFGIVYVINSQTLPTLPPPLNDNLIVRAPAFPDITLTLDIIATEPEYMLNIGGNYQSVRGNLTVGKAAFSSPYLTSPLSAIDATDAMWRSKGSTGSWLYVDLGEAATFRMLVASMMIDVDDTTPVETYYIISDDLKTWRVVYDDTDYHTYIPWSGPVILLPQSVTARYVGLYAQNWGGGSGAVVEFMVLP